MCEQCLHGQYKRLNTADGGSVPVPPPPSPAPPRPVTVPPSG